MIQMMTSLVLPASAGSTPAASLKRPPDVPVAGSRFAAVRASAGSTPAASLKPAWPPLAVGRRSQGRIRGVYPRGLIEARHAHSAREASRTLPGIRGVYPRGLIEAYRNVSSLRLVACVASAGSTPAASLKRGLVEKERYSHHGGGIRGVYPRGLIEAALRLNINWRGRLAVRIRGVYPRGLIEATARRYAPWNRRATRAASAGSTPAASLKHRTTSVASMQLVPWSCIRGVYPRGLIEASTEHGWTNARRRRSSIRGVYPRGLIEALSRSASRPQASGPLDASAGSTPAASLKHLLPISTAANPTEQHLGCIRGVYPRGLIEAPARPVSDRTSGICIRGVYPRGLIEARWSAVASNRRMADRRCIRGVYPRGLIEAARGQGGSTSKRCIRGVYPRGLIEAINAFCGP